MVEVLGIEPRSERVPIGPSPSKLLYTPNGWEVTLSGVQGSVYHLFIGATSLPVPVGYTLSFTSQPSKGVYPPNVQREGWDSPPTSIKIEGARESLST